MAYVITQNCCRDASCIPACPVDCIRPVGGTAEYLNSHMLYIDPASCIDCGACVEECPVDAIHLDTDLPPAQERFKEINAAYFEQHTLTPITLPPEGKRLSVKPGSLRVAVVGSGPAGCYAAKELVAIDGVEVDLFERLPTPYGLIRAGVAPDHQSTKSVVEMFEEVLTHNRVACHFNIEIGRDLSHRDLLAHHHAVVYAAGTYTGRELGIAGDHLAGNYAAADFVAWYNGHPDHAGDTFDLSGHRAVIVGNGNVALDVARVLLMSRNELAETDIAQHALDALSDSKINEVVILGRRGLRDAAFSVAEFLALGYLDGIDVVVEGADFDGSADDDHETGLKLQLAQEYVQRPRASDKRIIFRFMTSPVEIVGTDRVEALRVASNHLHANGALSPEVASDSNLIDTSLILRSIGYKGSPIGGLPYDAIKGVMPNVDGRVITPTGDSLHGTYVTGWIKRGPQGVIGTNRACAEQTVARLWEDFNSGVLSRDIDGRDALELLLAYNDADPIGWAGWHMIDTLERERGAQESRPRAKFVAVADMIAATMPWSEDN
ncbi:ferredoxin [Rhodococcus sp. 1R11]|uniref:4Fe-4S binding protein n=1 Tax=Rhodococcus sp. 1R11 TaxID=2559614 RepID=UPI0010720A53|nr:4Fe-4S binding protein [Rhodococcus sp. 1R11]TFI42429.1 ferredoxin [Rhodococcus sp. 1R11]